jgi:hypothetical protein
MLARCVTGDVEETETESGCGRRAEDGGTS